MNSTESKIPTAGLAVAAGALALAATARAADERRASTDPLKNATPNERDQWFTASPDPWKELPKLAWGGDRTFATGLQTVIIDADPKQWPGFENKLLAVLKAPGCTDCARDFVCRMLYYIGSPRCVPELSVLLQDEKQSDRARYALQAIPGPAPEAAFLEALPILKGNAKAGLIGALGLRGVKEAVEMLKVIQADPAEQAVVREAAERALARIQA
jgi:hypothetical protein